MTDGGSASLDGSTMEPLQRTRDAVQQRKWDVELRSRYGEESRGLEGRTEMKEGCSGKVISVL